jgi:universal stress protein A
MEGNALELKHLMVPTDFSKFSDLAIRYASFLAKSFNARLTLLHVLTVSEVNALTSQPGNPWENVVEEFNNRMYEEFLDNTIDKEAITVNFEVAVGDPAEEIAKFAENNDVDMLVMGTHGRTGLASIFLGSVTVGVIKRTCVPVTVVKCFEALKE